MSAKLQSAWRRSLAAGSEVTLNSPCAAGLPALRLGIANYLLRRRGVTCSADDIVVVGGAQQALSLIARVVLDEGESAVIEDPHYPSARQALVAHGARLFDTGVDYEGLITSELPGSPPRLIMVTPSPQFPSGSVMSLNRRRELLTYASKHRCWVVEDDYGSEFHFDGRPPPSLHSLDQDGHVFHVGTFSRTLLPGLRLGYIVCPPTLREDIRQAKALEDLGCSVTEQAALAAFLERRQYEKHLRSSIPELRRNRKALLAGVSSHLKDHVDVAPSHGGLHVVIWFRRLNWSDFDLLLERAAMRGVGLQPIHPFYKERPRRPGLMLGFAASSGQNITTAMTILGCCVDEIAPSR